MQPLFEPDISLFPLVLIEEELSELSLDMMQNCCKVSFDE